MKTRVMLAVLFVLGLGTSGYYTQQVRTTQQPSFSCCGGDPGIPTPVPLPVPQPAPQPGK